MSTWRFNPVYSPSLATESVAPEWLCEGVLVGGMPAVIGGPPKALKTSLAIDLAVSLDSGTPFLNTFQTPARKRVAVLSGESGRYTLAMTARAVCESRNLSLVDRSIIWQFDLPQLSSVDDLAILGEGLARENVDVCIIDPLYLCLLSGGMGGDAANLYSVGPLLASVSRTCIEAGATPILIHHSRKGKQVDVPQLGDLAYSGVAEYARQWVLLARRKPYQPDGLQSLWLCAGGSAGHSGIWGVDVDIGVSGSDLASRKWDVRVYTRQELEQQKSNSPIDRKLQRAKEAESRVLTAMDELSSNEHVSVRMLRDATGMSGSRLGDVIDTLVARGVLERIPVPGRRRGTIEGVRRLIPSDSLTVDPTHL